MVGALADQQNSADNDLADFSWTLEGGSMRLGFMICAVNMSGKPKGP